MENFSAQNRDERGKALQQRKEEVYAAIKEMEFDYGMGKVSEEDYQELRSQYKVRALEIMKELDTLDRGEDVDAAIEKEVQQLRVKGKAKGESIDEEEDVEEINFCPQCGRKIDPENNFCTGCGMRLRNP